MAACAQQAFTAAVMEKRKRQVHIDQDLHVYCQDRDLFFGGFVPPPFRLEPLFSHLSVAPRSLMQMFS